MATAVAQLSGRQVPWAVVAGGTLLALVGFTDDRLDLPARLRLLLQLVSGVAFGYLIGGVAAAVIAAVAVPVLVNAVNFMDGINGITALTVAVWGVTVLTAAGPDVSPALVIIAAAAAGAALGFLPWNIPAAFLFLGDVGSYLFGSLIAFGTVVGLRDGVPVTALLSPLAVYGVDTAWTLVRRARRGERLMDPHRDHIYQQLVRSGRLSHLTVAGFCAVVAGLVAVSWRWLDVFAASAVTLALLSLYLLSPIILAQVTSQGVGAERGRGRVNRTARRYGD